MSTREVHPYPLTHPPTNDDKPHEFFIIPADIMAREVAENHRQWLAEPGIKGQQRNDSSVRAVHLPPYASFNGWRIDEFKSRWELIENTVIPDSDK